MNKNIDFKLYLFINKENKKTILDVSNESKLLIDINESLKYGIKRKHVDQYLFRHKEIKTFKQGQIKLVPASFLINFILNDFKRIRRKDNKNIYI